MIDIQTVLENHFICKFIVAIKYSTWKLNYYILFTHVLLKHDVMINALPHFNFAGYEMNE